MSQKPIQTSEGLSFSDYMTSDVPADVKPVYSIPTHEQKINEGDWVDFSDGEYWDFESPEALDHSSYLATILESSFFPILKKTNINQTM